MAITPQHQKGEPTEADLEHAYNRARSIGLFLVEKYAREVLRTHPELEEFIIENGVEDFKLKDGSSFRQHDNKFDYSDSAAMKRLLDLLSDWDGSLDLVGPPMRFTADGPIRREW